MKGIFTRELTKKEVNSILWLVTVIGVLLIVLAMRGQPIDSASEVNLLWGGIDLTSVGLMGFLSTFDGFDELEEEK